MYGFNYLTDRGDLEVRVQTVLKLRTLHAPRRSGVKLYTLVPTECVAILADRESQRGSSEVQSA